MGKGEGHWVGDGISIIDVILAMHGMTLRRKDKES